MSRAQKRTYDQPGTMLQAVKNHINTTTLTYMELYDATGLQPQWLADVASGKFNNPSVNRIQYLYEFFTRGPLPIKGA